MFVLRFILINGFEHVRKIIGRTRIASRNEIVNFFFIKIASEYNRTQFVYAVKRVSIFNFKLNRVLLQFKLINLLWFLIYFQSLTFLVVTTINMFIKRYFFS